MLEEFINDTIGDAKSAVHQASTQNGDSAQNWTVTALQHLIRAFEAHLSQHAEAKAGANSVQKVSRPSV